jgi:ABC-2 type transport system permease protein
MHNWIGFRTLLRREVMRFLSLPNQTIVPSLVTVAMFVVVFGFFVGSKVNDIHGLRYVVFIFPGLLMMNALTAAFQNASTSLFIARWEHFIEDLLVAPLSYLEMVVAYLVSSMFRGIVNGVVVLVLGTIVLGIRPSHPFLCLMSLSFGSLVFSAFGLLVGLWAQRWDNIAIFQNFVVTPLTFLGGVFYSTSTLPENLRWMNEFNPIFYMVEAVRHTVLGFSEVSYTLSMGVTVGLAIVLSGAVFELFRRGYNLRS